MELRFVAKIWKTGNAKVMTVPKAFIEGGLINPAKRYVVRVEEANKASDALFTISTDNFTGCEI